MKKILLPCVMCAVLLISHGTLPAEELPAFQVIINADNPTTSLPRTQVSKILLKSVSRWGKGRPAEPVDQPTDSSIRKSFSKEVHGRSVSSIESYWQRQIFSGRNAPPTVLRTDQEVIDFVKGNVGAIGYISVDTPADGVQVLTITD